MNPNEINLSLGLTGSHSANPISPSAESELAESSVANIGGDVSSVDTNGNGQVTIKEVKAVGCSMPIMSDYWLYPYMWDNENEGMVSE